MTHLVNIEGNLVVALSPWFHEILIPPAPPVPGPGYDIPCMQKWAGYAMSGKFTTKVMHRNECICLDGHNVGMAILHITYPPSALLALHILFSERKMLFSASTVQMEKQAVACSGLKPIPTPMMDCGDPVGNPLTVFPMNFCNTVEVGMTLMDLVWGIVGLAVDLIIDLVFLKLEKKTTFKAVIGSYKKNIKFSKKALRELRSNLTKTFTKANFKDVAKEAGRKFLPFTDYKSLGKWGLKVATGSALDSIKADKVIIKTKVGHGNFAEVGLQVGSEYKGTASTFGCSYDSSASASSGSAASSSGNTPQVNGNPPADNLTP